MRFDRPLILERWWGVAKLVKAPDFDSGIRRFESYLPSHLLSAGACLGGGLKWDAADRLELAAKGRAWLSTD
jgi:hypothetical protein